jgi:hypothetical protein
VYLNEEILHYPTSKEIVDPRALQAISWKIHATRTRITKKKLRPS